MSDEELDRLKTGSLERRWRLAMAGAKSGARLAARFSSDWWLPEAEREQRRRQSLSREAKALAEELGRLKGSAVKLGQMLATYGAHVLPPEVVQALRTLEADTTPVAWSVMQPVLQQRLGSRYPALAIDPEPLAAASLAQVYRAREASGHRELCLKLQYPGVRDAVDSDLDSIAQVIRWSGLLGRNRQFEPWLETLRALLHRELDYAQEAAATRFFRDRLQNDSRFVVPEVIDDDCADGLLSLSFEAGLDLRDERVQALSQPRRNRLGEALLELFFREVFDWGFWQTDSHFGNYRVRIGRRAHEDQLVLLDFGAAQPYPQPLLDGLRGMMRAAYVGDLAGVREGAFALGMLSEDLPESVQADFTAVCAAVIEPLCPQRFDTPSEALNAKGEYRWRNSNLPGRLSKRAAKAATSVHFTVPPGEFILLSRKLVGVYGLIAALGAELDAGPLFERYADIAAV